MDDSRSDKGLTEEETQKYYRDLRHARLFVMAGALVGICVALVLSDRDYYVGFAVFLASLAFGFFGHFNCKKWVESEHHFFD